MELSTFDNAMTQDVVHLFTSVFSDSEGHAEGALIGSLVFELIHTTDQQDLFGFVAISNDEIIGSIFFSRLTLSNNKPAFILSPVAIATSEQRKGIGQRLIKYGIEHLKSRSVELLFTYGDPRYYAKVGFKHIDEDSVKAPVKLTHPEGWLAQSLSSDDIEMRGISSRCVSALHDPKYW